jgi:hypothetical protein
VPPKKKIKEEKKKKKKKKKKKEEEEEEESVDCAIRIRKRTLYNILASFSTSEVPI